jgi:predicted transcriptional regulator
MLLGTKKNLYEYVVEALLIKPLYVSQIQNYLHDKKIPATIQGIYKALRELIKEDVVVKQKKIYLINSVWRKKLEIIVSKKPPFQLFQGEKISYQFNKLDHLDMFWKHTITDIQNEFEGFPIFHGDPHNF